ncbi:MAG: DUF4270 domain-containing protein [Bacteroidales bacterium]|nr:DUF4270 domain-containing protein [Bacteroidales bacterium]
MRYFVLALALALTLSSCKKDLTSEIGGDLQPSNEYILAAFNGTHDSLNLIAYTIEDVPSVTSHQSTYALGSYRDATFGTITTNIISQIFPLSTYDSIGTILEVDSVVLMLIYSNAHPFKDGQPMDPFVINIGELEEVVEVTDTSHLIPYYSNDNRIGNGAVILANHRIEPDIRDSILNPNDVTGETKIHVPLLRIPIYADDKKNNDGKTFGHSLLDAYKTTFGDASMTNKFLEKIKGLYIETLPEETPGSGNIINFDFSGSVYSPGIIVYYQTTGKTADGEADSIVSRTKEFGFGETDARFPLMIYNYINIDRSSQAPELTNQLNKSDTTLGQNMVYLQSFFGSLVRVEMPNIRGFANDTNIVKSDQTLVINQATLILNTAPNGANERFTPTPSLGITYQKTTDSMFNLRDHSVAIGGGYNSDKGEYRIILTRHIQNILANSDEELLKNKQIPNIPLTIFPNSRASIPDITSIIGPSEINGDKRMRLEIIYSIVPK